MSKRKQDSKQELPAPAQAPSLKSISLDALIASAKTQKNIVSKNPQYRLQVWLINTPAYPSGVVISEQGKTGQSFVLSLPLPNANETNRNANVEAFAARLTEKGLNPFATQTLPFFNGSTITDEQKIGQVENVDKIIGRMVIIGNATCGKGILSTAVGMYGTPINIQNDPMPWFDINYNPENDVKAIISWVGPDHPMGGQIDGQSASFTIIVPNAFTRDFLPLQNMMKKKGFLWKSVFFTRNETAAHFWVHMDDVHATAAILDEMGIKNEVQAVE